MTAKEKAIEIRDRMYKCPYVQEEEAKRCALVAVDIILSDLVYVIGFDTPTYNFYEDVKKELIIL
jgi:hypothetical protein